MTTTTTEATIHGINDISEAARIMLVVSMEEGDVTAAEAQACVDAILSLRNQRQAIVASARPYVTDGEWASLTDDQKTKLDQAFRSGDTDALIDFIGEPLSKGAVKVLQAESSKAVEQAAKEAASRLSCQGGFFYSAPKKAYYPQVNITGPVPKGFSDIRHRSLSAHQVALTAALCRDVGAEVVLDACRDALECVKIAKENKVTVSTFANSAED